MDVSNLIEKLYNEPDIEKRKYIPDKLAKIGDWSSTVPLGELIIDHSQPDSMRNEAVESLGKQGDPRAVSYLKQVLDDKDDELRRTAVWSLGQIGTPNTLDIVFSMTDDPNLDVRRWVAKSAGRIRNKDVIKYLIQYFESLDLEDEERVLADILRAVTSQIQRSSKDERIYWVKRGYELLSNDNLKNYVKQATILMMNSCFHIDIEPNGKYFLNLVEELPKNDPLIRPNVIHSLGYAKQVEFLRKLNESSAIIGLGIANDVKYLKNELRNTSFDNHSYLTSLFAGFIKTDYLPDISQYLKHNDLNVKLKALELHALHTQDIQVIHNAYEIGEGRYKLLEIYRYYGELSIPIFEESAFDEDKVARQNSVYSLISDEMLRVSSQSLKSIKNILTGVAMNDRIWHIRRDARIGIERINKMIV